MHRLPVREAQPARTAQADQDYISAHPEDAAALTAAFVELTRQGVSGWVDEAILLTQPLEFRLEDISTPFQIRHGKDDKNVPVAHARHVAEELPNCRLTLGPGSGHFFMGGRFAEVLSESVLKLDDRRPCAVRYRHRGNTTDG